MRGVAGAFEAEAHYEDMYYRWRKLGQISGCSSVSPSGRFVIFTGVGTMQLFDKQTRKLREVTDDKFALPQDFIWKEQEGIVLVKYYAEERKPSVVRLESADKGGSTPDSRS